MNIPQDHKKRIEEIIRGMRCPKDFACYKSGFEKLSRVATVVPDEVIECLEEDRKGCDFALPFGDSHFCECPLRLYIRREFHK